MVTAVSNFEQAVSVWIPRDGAAQAARTLEFCNQAFLDLYDVSSFPSSDFEAALAVNQVDLEDPEIESFARQSFLQLCGIMDALHRCEIRAAILECMLISRIGRIKWVRLEANGEFADGKLAKIVLSMCPLQRAPEVLSPIVRVKMRAATTAAAASGQQQPSSPIDPTLSPTVSPPTPPAPPSMPPSPLAANTPNGKRQTTFFRWRAMQLPKPRSACPTSFCCEFCGATTTVQRRRGPNGPGTLCNSCGLKWSSHERRMSAECNS